MTTSRQQPTMACELVYGSRRIPYRLHIADRKTLRIVVSPDLSVDVYAPAAATEPAILDALYKRAPWICRAIGYAAEFQPLPSPKKYVSGETFVYLGRQYRLRVEQGQPGPAKLQGRFLRVTVPGKADTAAVARIVRRWYVTRAHAIFAAHASACRAIAGRHGIPVATIAIRDMRTRWGSCTATGRITLNLNLVHAPVHCIDYVIMHELCHLLHHDHSAAFYRLLSRCMPDWQARRRQLAQIALPIAPKTCPRA